MRRCILSFAIGLGVAPVASGVPATVSLQFRQIEVSTCDPLTLEDLPDVSEYVKGLSDSAANAATRTAILAETSGYLVVARVVDERDIGIDVQSDRERAVSDTGWSGAPDGTYKFVYASAPADACERLAHGPRVTVVLDDRSSCDTDPPVGACVFDRVIREVDDDTRKRFDIGR